MTINPNDPEHQAFRRAVYALTGQQPDPALTPEPVIDLRQPAPDHDHVLVG